MPYIIRDEHGKVLYAYTQPLSGTEMVPYDNPDLVEFFQKNGQDIKKIDDALTELRKSDSDMARAVEDVITVLLRKNLLKMSDLPTPVQDRMAKRVKLRMEIQEAFDKASTHPTQDMNTDPYHTTR